MISSFKLSLQAEQDIDALFDYTEKEFSFDQALTYVLEFEPIFQLLIRNPELGKVRDEIKPGLRSIPKEAHVIFYRIMKNHIRIVRILHSSRDILRL